MSLSKKLLGLFGIFVGVFFVAILLLAQGVLLKSYEDLEYKNSRDNLSRLRSALEGEAERLETHVGDWAPWDDTYEFVQDGNEEYIESNLSPDTLINLDVNFTLYYNESGELVHGVYVDMETYEEEPVPEKVLKYFENNPFIVSHESTEDSLAGYVNISGDLLVLASKPVIKSNNEGPIKGALVFGRYFDDLKVEELSESIRLPIELTESRELGIETTSWENGEKIETMEDRIEIYTTISGMSEEEEYVGSTTTNRDIYVQGKNTVVYLAAALMLVMVVIAGLMAVFLWKGVVSPINKLTGAVVKMGKGDLKQRVEIESNDEVGKLSSGFNQMAEKLMEREKEVFDLSETIRLLNKILRHDILNDLSVVRGNIETYFDYGKKANLNESLKDILQSINRSIGFIGEMKVLEESVTSGKKLKPVKVEEVVEEVKKHFEELELNAKGEGKVLADEALDSVITNLVRNAMVHGKVKKVDILIEKKGKMVEVRVADNGKGIKDEIKKQLFQEGFQYGETGNTGLGLYIVKKTIERYGGEVRIEDNKPKGTVFVLQIPNA